MRDVADRAGAGSTVVDERGNRRERRPPDRRGAGRRAVVGAASWGLNRPWFFRTLGLLNRWRPFIASVFVAYPADPAYASHYSNPGLIERSRWSPTLCSVFRQNGKFTVGLGISADERAIRARSNAPQLGLVLRRAERVASQLGVDTVTFAGVLPGVFERRGFERRGTEAEVTAAVVARSVERLDELEGVPSDRPLVVLGGRGYVGSLVVEHLADRETYPVDVGDAIPPELHGRKCVVVNVASRRALRQRSSEFWPEVTVLNEAYPEPSPEVVATLDRLGIATFHIVGVEATAIPRMPGVYAGGIPCCAAWTADAIAPIVRNLTASNDPSGRP